MTSDQQSAAESVTVDFADLYGVDLDAIRARVEAATDGPWERGEVWQWAGVGFGNGPSKCALCARMGDPVWTGRSDINGKRMLAHKHRNPDPWHRDHLISNPHGLVTGNYDYEAGGVIDSADTEFIAHARQDVPKLLEAVVGVGLVELQRDLYKEASRLAIAERDAARDDLTQIRKTMQRAVDGKLDPGHEERDHLAHPHPHRVDAMITTVR